MNTLRASTIAPRGFSLIELIVAMGISTILMAALASIFANSINAREKIDREGQKIETARYSLDTLAEDIRLAGYYGSYSPPFTGATPADWKYVDPWSTTGGNPLPGWNSATAPVQVPFPIFGYEAHGTGDPPAELVGEPTDSPPYTSGVLPNYRPGTDVLVIRRASTTSITAGGAGYVSGDPYIQVSSCPDDAVDGPDFHAMATATSTDLNLHVLGCTSLAAGPTASVRKLITRIYYVARCDDCVNDLDKDSATTGDGVPTLKMVELGIPTGGSALKVKENLRTIAPGVENLHLEYGVDTTDDGSVDAWVVSNENPRKSESIPDPLDIPVAGMRLDTLINPLTLLPYPYQENRWEDVMSVKLFLITRDLQPTRSYNDTKSYVMGSTTWAPPTDDPFRRRLTATTVKLVNMSGRREKP